MGMSEKLRESQCAPNTGCSPSMCLCGLMDEAADRIEHLEAQVASLKDPNAVRAAPSRRRRRGG